MKLIPDWRRVLRYAWSVRLIVLAGLLTGAEAVLPFFPELFGMTPQTWAALTFGVVAAALVARLIAQQSISGGDDE